MFKMPALFKRSQKEKEEKEAGSNNQLLPPVWWRDVVARLSLPMLAGGAAAGVFQFNSETKFVNDWVAGLIAGSFELTYVGLALLQNLPDNLRGRARRIAVGAMTVSMIYNILGGLFARNPDFLKAEIWPSSQLGWRLAFEGMLAVVHGAPLALLAYLTSDLVLHTTVLPVVQPHSNPQPQPQPQFDFGAFADRLREELRAGFEAQLGQMRGAVAEQIAATNRNLETVAADIGNRLTEVQQPQGAVEGALLRTEIAELRTMLETAITKPQPSAVETEALRTEIADLKKAVETAVQSAIRNPQSSEVRPKLRMVESQSPSQNQQQPPQGDPQQYAKALRLYNELGNFAAVGRALGKSENTAKTWVRKAQGLAGD